MSHFRNLTKGQEEISNLFKKIPKDNNLNMHINLLFGFCGGFFVVVVRG